VSAAAVAAAELGGRPNSCKEKLILKDLHHHRCNKVRGKL